LALQSAQKLPDGHDANSIPLGHLDQINVAFEIVVPSHQIPRLASDGRFQDFIVIGIATDL
jgi:hypothetical protein